MSLPFPLLLPSIPRALAYAIAQAIPLTDEGLD